MIRELKCRAWNGHKKEWYDPKLIKVSLDFSLIGLWCGPDHGYIFNDTASWDVTIQVYTGLKDKNGKEIYEGDILIFRPAYDESLGGQFGNAIFSVSFKDASFRFGDELADQGGANYYEVIGNIFENPELLKP